MFGNGFGFNDTRSSNRGLAEVRFTRDVDIAVVVADDSEAESLTYELRLAGYSTVASVEHEKRHRVSSAVSELG